MLDVHVVKARAHFDVDVAFALEPGTACGLFGASGAGKSTVLACIAGVEAPDRGAVVSGGVTYFPPSLPLHDRVLGYLTQAADLFPHLRVGENVWFGIPARERARHAAWIDELRGRLEIASLWHAPVGQISGGQARRVALARMLARRPPLILLDEPFTGLDRTLVRALVAAIAEWQHRLGFTLVVVDHDAEILARLCPRAIAIERGRIVQDAGWDELRLCPATETLRQLLAPL